MTGTTSAILVDGFPVIDFLAFIQKNLDQATANKLSSLRYTFGFLEANFQSLIIQTTIHLFKRATNFFSSLVYHLKFGEW